MSVRPVRLNAAIAWLFIVGSACFVLGSVPAYVDAVGGTRRRHDLLRRLDLLHVGVVLPARAGPDPGDDRRRRGGQHGRRRCGSWAGCRTTAAGWPRRPSSPARCSSTSAPSAALTHNATAAESDRHVWRPDLFGSIAVPRRQRVRHPRRLRPLPRRRSRGRCRGGSPGSTCSARSCSWPPRWPATSCRAPTSCVEHPARPSPARCSAPLCFLVGAALMFPAWRQAAHARPADTTPPRRSA